MSSGVWKWIGWDLSSELYDVLPSPANLHILLGEDPSCSLYKAPATLKYILVSCKTILTQGRYTWWLNQALKLLEAELESKRVFINPPQPFNSLGSWEPPISEQEKKKSSKRMFPYFGLFNGGRDWRRKWTEDKGSFSHLRLQQPYCDQTWSSGPNLIYTYAIKLIVPSDDAVDEERRIVLL